MELDGHELRHESRADPLRCPVIFGKSSMIRVHAVRAVSPRRHSPCDVVQRVAVLVDGAVAEVEPAGAEAAGTGAAVVAVAIVVAAVVAVGVGAKQADGRSPRVVRGGHDVADVEGPDDHHLVQVAAPRLVQVARRRVQQRRAPHLRISSQETAAVSATATVTTATPSARKHALAQTVLPHLLVALYIAS